MSSSVSIPSQIRLKRVMTKTSSEKVWARINRHGDIQIHDRVMTHQTGLLIAGPPTEKFAIRYV